jgi:hypothetical protein
MTKDLYNLSHRTGGTLDCRLAFRASVVEKRMLLESAKKHNLSLGEYVLALHRYYHGEKQ